jgi:hypothetical protein
MEVGRRHGLSKPAAVEWMAEHPGWVRFPATMVPREPEGGDGGPQWNIRFDLPDAPAAPEAAPVADATATRDGPAMEESAGGAAPRGPGDGIYSTTASAYAAWRNVRDVFADPMGAAGLRRVADTQPDGARSYADYADMLLGIGSAWAQPVEPEEENRDLSV